jgi:hypothetical protein
MKTIDQHFADWESDTFGYGYGTGEEHIVKALKNFFFTVPQSGNYDYQAIELECGPQVAWLLMCALIRADMIEYGTSPRYGWLTTQGQALGRYLRSHTCAHLEEVLETDESYIHCYRDHCNCDKTEGDCREHNPFWPPPKHS